MIENMFSDLAPKFQMYRTPNDQKRHYTCKQTYYSKQVISSQQNKT